ncbi:hypothetical protein DPEC_G00171260 [Dallia pectoralis]|uniref:Uncharacterized protein n=1 Tax=Dallia pectoralis TaxID=75939 RepID=A0ACC2GD44_DALPE|nr:hypothetical protein DPEC_G00171260 [Dallia pectoralis]
MTTLYLNLLCLERLSCPWPAALARHVTTSWIGRPDNHNMGDTVPRTTDSMWLPAAGGAGAATGRDRAHTGTQACTCQPTHTGMRRLLSRGSCRQVSCLHTLPLQ